ncbi:glutathione S-transferase family protein [Henriciella litoralis]|uniref:glutathione S-transferase family protein n=1 Tax=Henriciella litoralis TaxID=568102 RepID=UPI001F271AD5|nr:glutathione S-transferase family protein [Henriciella litoralis]
MSGNLNYSSWSIRALLMVRHLGLEVEEEIVPLDFPDTTTRLAEISPTRKVPLLIWDDETVWDSLAIIEWLAERHAGVWPKDQKARARARAISAEMHSGFPALRSACPMDIRARHDRPDMTEKLAADIARVDAIWTETRKEFGAGGDFLFGEWSAADAVYAPVVTRFVTYDLPRSEIAQAYMSAVMSHPLMVTLAAESAEEPWWIKYGSDGRSSGFIPSGNS